MLADVSITLTTTLVVFFCSMWFASVTWEGDELQGVGLGPGSLWTGIMVAT